MVEPIEVRHLGIGDLDALSSIDRSERVDAEYTVRDGRIIERPVSMTEIPNWDPVGTGPYSLAAQVAYCQDLIERGAFFIGALGGIDRSRPCRRRNVDLRVGGTDRLGGRLLPEPGLRRRRPGTSEAVRRRAR